MAIYNTMTAPCASSLRNAASILPTVSGRAVFRKQLPFATQRTRRQFTAHSASQPGLRRSSRQSKTPTILEVERKFAPTTASMQQLASNAGYPPFQSVIHHGTTSFEDAYYDTADEALCDAGVWLRRRGERWEAKIRVGGDFTNSAFEEVTSVEDISAMLAKLVPGAALDLRDGPTGGRVREVAMLVTERKKFLVDGKFTVVLDETDFGHVVGEVEMERQIYIPGQGDVDRSQEEDQQRAQMIAEMDHEIDDFMKRYKWAFPPGKPVGKLSAYFALKQRQ